MNQIKTVIFDLDGVLWNSMEAHARAYRTVFKGKGIEGFVYEPFAGMRTDDVFRGFLTQKQIPFSEESLVELVKEKQQLAIRQLERYPPIDSECVSTLAKLSGRFTLGLATSASRPTMETFLKALGPNSLFRACFCADMVKEAKPSPEIFLKCAEQIGTSPENCVVVEDSMMGTEAAVRAGMKVVVRANTRPPWATSPQIIAVVSRLGEIPGVL